MDGYKEFVIWTNKPVHVEKNGDIIGAQMLQKHGELIDRKEVIKRFNVLKKFAEADRNYILAKAYETIITELKKFNTVVWAS